MNAYDALRLFGRIAGLISGGFAVFVAYVLAITWPVPQSPTLAFYTLLGFGLAVLVLWLTTLVPNYNPPRRSATFRDRLLGLLID